ncbi:Trm112 family protein [Arhodomonas sp. AD133]|uniref:Trm112 family protein n=1 Tax=Arhodomonas sp. AD133 TaxID=3415009 RepID=UPI003EBD760E
MPLDRKLLDVLCCPVTKVPVRPLRREELKRVNEAIDAAELHHMDDTPVETALEEGLVTTSGERVYRVDDGIPIMLEERGILVRELGLK